MSQNELGIYDRDTLKTKAEIAKILAVSTRTVESWMSDRKIPFMRVGKIVRFDALRVLEHLHRCYDNAAHASPGHRYAALYSRIFEAKPGKIENQTSPVSRVTNSA